MSIEELISQLTSIRNAILDVEEEYGSRLSRIHPNYRYSAINLLRYLKLRTYDLRDMQDELSDLGLSSIGNSGRYVLSNIENILYFLNLHVGNKFIRKHEIGKYPINYKWSQVALTENANRLFKSSGKSYTSVMVTLPSQAEDYEFVKKLLLEGMEVARINCSHDNPSIWERMVNNVRRASRETENRCAIYMDLAGPKLRTGLMKSKKGYLLLKPGDALHLYRSEVKKKDVTANSIPKVSCTIPSVLQNVKVGDQIWFNDGKIGGKVISDHRGFLEIRITNAKPKGSKLKAEKGINLPDTSINIHSLTKYDLEIIPIIAKYADIIGYSFVKTPEDVKRLQEQLNKHNRKDMGIVLKIENHDAFYNLPALLLQAMESESVGIMTARGDLAVELGAERLSEAQEEILWICEAACVPNIWATQVLENLVKKGIASRPEITDAAMSARVECVMLNKGPYILEALKTISNIIGRMEEHQYKRKGTLRKLNIASTFLKKKLDLREEIQP